MRNICLSIALMVSLSALGQFQKLNSTAIYTQNGSFAAADIDKDGKLDLIYMVSNPWSNNANLWGAQYINKGHRSFEEIIDNNLVAGAYATISLGDTDGDGNMDMVYGGKNRSGVVLNLGSNEILLDQQHGSVSTGFVDFDNTGYYGFFLIGGAGKSLFPRLESQYGWKLLGDGGAIWTQNATSIDFDNDGDMDIYVTGSFAPDYKSSTMYVNNGDGTYTANSDIGVIKYADRTSVAWGDLNGDGFADLVIGGACDEAEAFYVYLNNQAGKFIKGAKLGDAASWSAPYGCSMGDWNNDGYVDIITVTNSITVYYNDGNGNFTTNSSWVGGVGAAGANICLADMDDDAKLDIAVSGNGWIDGAAREYTAIVYNETPNTNDAPNAPTNLNYSKEQSIVTLSWDKAIDDKTPSNSLSYNLYVKNKDTGRWYINPLASTSGTSNGSRQLSGIGNIHYNNSWSLKNLPNGLYEWSVQAIDAGYKGSAFAPIQTFAIGPTTSIDELSNNLSIIALNNTIHVNGAINSTLAIYTLGGQLMFKDNIKNSTVEVPLSRGCYIVVIDGIEKVCRKIVI